MNRELFATRSKASEKGQSAQKLDILSFTPVIDIPLYTSAQAPVLKRSIDRGNLIPHMKTRNDLVRLLSKFTADYRSVVRQLN